MPQRKYSIKLGQREPQVVEAAGTPISGGNAVEINIDFSPRFQRKDAILLLEQVIRRIHMGKWPPA